MFGLYNNPHAPKPAIPFDGRGARRSLRALAEMLQGNGFKGARGLSRAIRQSENRRLLLSVFGCSPFLTRIILRRPETLLGPLGRAPDTHFQRLLKAISAHSDKDTPLIGAEIRRLRQEVAVAVALADLSGRWALAEVVQALSAFADTVLREATRQLLFDAIGRREFQAADPSVPENGAGLFVLALGKLGGGELNYSSDIDIVIYFDEAVLASRTDNKERRFAIDFGRRLLELLQGDNGEGYVFRVDLRLRPDPGSTQIAMSTKAAEQYYQAYGQNWERAALIKARPVAGDQRCARAFLDRMQPFIWRRELDYNTIEDVHAIKGQLESHVRSAALGFEGHNIKLGRGGIRQIEFFVQTQQLILGGQHPALRGRATLDVLRALTAHRLISSRALTQLTAAYAFLRRLEHRLQMIEDQQTHTVPTDAQYVLRIANFMGYRRPGGLQSALFEHLRRVEGHYADLFKDAPAAKAAQGPLVFTGVEDDPATLEMLQGMGFDDPAGVSETLRQWHRGHVRATKTERARELLTKLVPALLKACAETGDPNDAFRHFADFVERLPQGTQVFALLHHNGGLLAELARLLGRAPRVSARLAAYPYLLELMIAPPRSRRLAGRAVLQREFGQLTSSHESDDDWLLAARRWLREKNFLVCLQLFNRSIGPDEVAEHFTVLADVTLAGVYDRVWRDVVRGDPNSATADHCVLALGRLGAGEMTAASDLDLVFLFRANGVTGRSDMATLQNRFVHFSQRVVSALSADSYEGKLYDVDLRLRPSGRAGPVTAEFESYFAYHSKEAETWETIALLKARPVAGSPALARDVEKRLAELFRHGRNARPTRADVAHLRGRIANELSTGHHWDLKYGAGGLMDVDLLAALTLLVKGGRLRPTARRNAARLLAALRRRGLLSRSQFKDLTQAYTFQQNLTQILRVAHFDLVRVEDMTPGVKTALYRLLNSTSFEVLEKKLKKLQSRVRRHVASLIG